MEETNELTSVGLVIGEEEEAISWVDDCCKDLVHNYSPHASSLATSCANKNWVKGFFLLMPSEEHDIFTLLVEGLIVNPCGLTSASLEVELFSMQVCLSIDWVARHMMEMSNLEGKHFVCINGVFHENTPL